MPDDVKMGLGKLSTASISDALDRLRLPGSAHGIHPLFPSQKMVGRAFTVRYVPVGPEGGTVGDYLDDCQAGDVVVLDNGGRTDCTVWGDILTWLASDRGLAGTVINGVSRDVARARDLGYPIFNRGRFMRTGKDRVTVSEVNGMVSLGDVQVRPRDIVVGDDDGVVVVPATAAAYVLQAALEISEREAGIVQELQGGATLADARRRHGYHQLQAPQTEGER